MPFEHGGFVGVFGKDDSKHVRKEDGEKRFCTWQGRRNKMGTDEYGGFITTSNRKIRGRYGCR